MASRAWAVVSQDLRPAASRRMRRHSRTIGPQRYGNLARAYSPAPDLEMISPVTSV
jgi:hypothetical protein